MGRLVPVANSIFGRNISTSQIAVTTSVEKDHLVGS